MLHEDGAELVQDLQQLVPGTVLKVHHLLDVMLAPPVLAEPDQKTGFVYCTCVLQASPDQLGQVGQLGGRGHGEDHRLLLRTEGLEQLLLGHRLL